VQAGADERLVGDADRLVELARAAGVPVGYDRWPGMWHDFQVCTGLLAAADQAVAALGRAIRHWWPDPAPTAQPAAASLAAGRDGPRVVIVGAGFGGLGMAIELTRRGHRSFTVLEKAASVGGVWRENTYPGAACDIPSLQYCYSFEPSADWSRRYAGQADIVAYLRRCVASYRLADHLRLGTEVVTADFDSAAGRWTVRTSTGEAIEADVLVFACGQLSRPSYPDIPGLERFAGTMFHSACWDHDHDLSGRRVAVIGTGSSALQFVPAIAGAVGQLTVFQRTAGWIVPKLDGAYPDRWRDRDRPARSMSVARRGLDLFEGAFTYGLTRHRSVLGPLRLVGRAQLRLQVRDPELRRKLTPAAEFGCKRVGFSNDYYPTFNRDNVTLVTDPIAEVTATGVRTVDGVLHEVDTIILGTGFASTDFLAPIRIRGAGGRDLAGAWRNGARAYLGITVPDFPNMFLMYGPNTNLGSGSIIYMLESQARYVGSAIGLLAEGRAGQLAVRSDVEDAYDRRTQHRLRRTAWVTCRNWYRTAAGRVTNNWPGQLREYRRLTDHLDLADYHRGR
jgi:cation diffusion facilitator CzcD-associated flavoprotein CzcO